GSMPGGGTAPDAPQLGSGLLGPVVPGNLPAFGPVMIAVRSVWTRFPALSSIFRIGVLAGIELPSGYFAPFGYSAPSSILRWRSVLLPLVTTFTSAPVTWLRYHSAPAGCTFSAPNNPLISWLPTVLVSPVV